MLNEMNEALKHECGKGGEESYNYSQYKCEVFRTDMLFAPLGKA